MRKMRSASKPIVSPAMTGAPAPAPSSLAASCAAAATWAACASFLGTCAAGATVGSAEGVASRPLQCMRCAARQAALRACARWQRATPRPPAALRAWRPRLCPRRPGLGLGAAELEGRWWPAERGERLRNVCTPSPQRRQALTSGPTCTTTSTQAWHFTLTSSAALSWLGPPMRLR